MTVARCRRGCERGSRAARWRVAIRRSVCRRQEIRARQFRSSRSRAIAVGKQSCAVKRSWLLIIASAPMHACTPGARGRRYGAVTLLPRCITSRDPEIASDHSQTFGAGTPRTAKVCQKCGSARELPQQGEHALTARKRQRLRRESVPHTTAKRRQLAFRGTSRRSEQPSFAIPGSE